MITANEALQRLQEGNARFVSGHIDRDGGQGAVRRKQVLAGQDPFAIIVGCSDSRVPVEIVFDQGLGDLFVIRVAGTVVSKTQLGSIEFAAQTLGARLVVVLGHTGCGAMDAALEAVQRGTPPRSENLRRIVDEIRPSAEHALASGGSRGRAELVDLVGREHVRSTVGVIRNSPGLPGQPAGDELMVIGAEYSLETGAVEFF
jgi:carbonic anhydrase